MARIELRKARRYGLSLPVAIHAPVQKGSAARNGKTRDISTRGIYFLIEADLSSSNEVNLTVTVPAEITGGTDVLISVTGHVVRVEDFLETNSKKVGVAATIERYEIFRSDAASS